MSYKRWIFIATFLFVIGLVFGLVASSDIASLILEDIAPVEDLSGILVPFKFLTVILIFGRNTLALLLSFALSPLLCLVPVLALIANGFFLGLISAIVIQEESLGFVLAGLLPHGIFELPALILGQAAALSFGVMVILAVFKKERRGLLSSGLKKNLRYLMLALILLLPAAIIETYITPLLLR